MSYVDYLWNVAHETVAEKLEFRAVRRLQVDHQLSARFGLRMKSDFGKAFKLTNDLGKRPWSNKNCATCDNQYDPSGRQVQP